MRQDSGADGDVIFMPDEDKATGDIGCWKILIVDDEKDVHAVTELALRNFSFEGKPLQFLHAYTGAEAVQIVAQQPDVAVILLDVIMESDDAGLSVATKIRNELGNKLVRIVLRTGQAGLFSEQQVVADYEINDYKTKAELTAQKLNMTLIGSLRNYRELAMVDKNHKSIEAKLLSNFAGSLKKYRAWKSNENHHRDLGKIFATDGSRIETPSMEQFIEGLISQTTALLRVQQNALLSHAAGNPGTKLELTDADDFSEYEFVPQQEIPSILRGICKHGALVTFFFNHGFDSLLTTPLDVSPDGKTIIFTCGNNIEDNHKLLKADKINCISSKNMVNICFIMNGVKPVKHQGSAAFLANVPDFLFRLQRREYHRLTLPLSKPLRASIPLPQE
jgi:CheY-like chemotaxis protein